MIDDASFKLDILTVFHLIINSDLVSTNWDLSATHILLPKICF